MSRLKMFDEFISEAKKEEPFWVDTALPSMFDKAWNVCKAHGKTKGVDKASIKQSRPGMVSMWIGDLQNANKLTPEEKKILGIDESLKTV